MQSRRRQADDARRSRFPVRRLLYLAACAVLAALAAAAAAALAETPAHLVHLLFP